MRDAIDEQAGRDPLAPERTDGGQPAELPPELEQVVDAVIEKHQTDEEVEAPLEPVPIVPDNFA